MTSTLCVPCSVDPPIFHFSASTYMYYAEKYPAKMKLLLSSKWNKDFGLASDAHDVITHNSPFHISHIIFIILLFSKYSYNKLLYRYLRSLVVFHILQVIDPPRYHKIDRSAISSVVFLVSHYVSFVVPSTFSPHHVYRSSRYPPLLGLSRRTSGRTFRPLVQPATRHRSHHLSSRYSHSVREHVSRIERHHATRPFAFSSFIFDSLLCRSASMFWIRATNRLNEILLVDFELCMYFMKDNE